MGGVDQAVREELVDGGQGERGDRAGRLLGADDIEEGRQKDDRLDELQVLQLGQLRL